MAETARWLRKLGARAHDHDGGGGGGGRGGGGGDGDGNGDAPRSHPSPPERRVLILANKLEGDRWSTNDRSPVLDHISEASRVGFGPAVPVSAEHGEGLADVAAVVESMSRDKRERLGLPESYDEHGAGSWYEESGGEKPLQLAILGRQNVGKSTLVNALLGRDRVIAGPTPGLTRDAIAVRWSWGGRPVSLCDTAGLRHVSRRDRSDGVEDMAVLDAVRAMRTADVAVLVLDAEARALRRQELAIADAVVKEGRALVVAANKMDLLVDAEYGPEDFADAVREHIEARFPMLRRTPVVAMSSLRGERVDDLMPVVFDARDRWARVVPTGLLNRWLREVTDERSPPPVRGLPARIKYIMQTKGRPPTFLLFCNVDELPKDYLRYLTRNFQETFRMFGMEVRLAVKKSAENPDRKSVV